MIPIIPILFVAPKLALVAKIVHSRRKAAKKRQAEEAEASRQPGNPSPEKSTKEKV